MYLEVTSDPNEAHLDRFRVRKNHITGRLILEFLKEECGDT